MINRLPSNDMISGRMYTRARYTQSLENVGDISEINLKCGIMAKKACVTVMDMYHCFQLEAASNVQMRIKIKGNGS